MLWEAHWLVLQHNKYKKYCAIHNTDTVAFTTHSGSYSTERKKEVHQLHMWYTTITAVHSTYMAQKHLDVKLLQP